MTQVRLRLAAARPGGTYAVYLLGEGGVPAGGLNLPADTVVARLVKQGSLDATGFATVDLTPTADLTPAGMVYRADLRSPGASVAEQIVFAGFSGAGPVEAVDHVVDVPGALAPAALAVETAARVAADAAHDAALAALPGTYVPLTDAAVRPVARDAFERPDGPIDGTAADSGQTWRSNPPGRIVSGRLVTSSGFDNSYNRLNLGAPMRSMSARFLFSTGTAGATPALALVNTADGTTNFLAGNNWIHLSINTTGWDFAFTTRDAGGTVTFDYRAVRSFATALLKDGTTVYGASMEARGRRLHITIWCDTTGEVLANHTVEDARVVSMLGAYCIWQPRDAGANGRSEFLSVSASSVVSEVDPPAPTRGETSAIIDARLADPIGMGVGTNLPPHSPITGVTRGGANWGIATRLLSDGPPSAQNIRMNFTVSSGNICVAVYRMANAGQLTRLATSGSIACPAVGAATIPLDVPVSARRGDWVAYAADNTTAAASGAAGAFLLPTTGVYGAGLIASGMPLPAGPIAATWYTTGPTHLMVLVP